MRREGATVSVVLIKLRGKEMLRQWRRVHRSTLQAVDDGYVVVIGTYHG